jgi:succinate dehydrogenase flavin-adding protein (antitoxin of CptAB toxin-antitoxin module)
MRELDSLLSGWVDRHWDTADSSTRSTFVDLLDAEDDALWDWVTGRSSPDDPSIADLVQRIVARRP